MGSEGQSNGFDMKKKTGTGDTSRVKRYTDIALKYVSIQGDVKFIKANIDSAELICKKENIEIPPLLHLARAKYFYLIEDFNKSSQEATIASELAEKLKDNKVLTKTLIFLGDYCLRTGFIRESIDYFNRAIVLAQKEHLKGAVPPGIQGSFEMCILKWVIPGNIISNF